MKKIAISALSAILALSVLAGAVLAAGSGEAVYDNRRELAEGFFYTNSISYNSQGKRVETFTLETDPDSPVYPVVMAEDMIYSSMTVTEMTEWARSRGWNVYGAINADFFYSSMDLPLGGVIQDGEYISSMNGENLLAFTSTGARVFKTPKVTITLDNGGRRVEVEHLNKMRTNTGGLFFYTHAYHDVSTNTTRPGWAVRFRVLSGEMTVSGRVELQVIEVLPEVTDIPLGEDVMVLSAPLDNEAYAGVYRDFAPGDRVTLTTSCTDKDLADVLWAAGCGDVLVENGAMTDDTAWDKSINKDMHPRTCLGIRADGSVVAYAVDGRNSGHSQGAYLQDAAADLINRGCVTAVNLDGGGSTVMAVRLPGDAECTVVNRPSDGKPRSCSSYILFVSDIRPDGRAAGLHIREDGALVLTGSSMPVTFAATDQAGAPAALPGSIEAECSLGTFRDGVYTAGDAAGVESIGLYAGTARGRGTVHVVDAIDSISVTDAATGKAPALSAMEPGESVSLRISGQRLGRDVYMDGNSVEYSVTEGLGQITPEGVFTAAANPGVSGEITVKAGGAAVTVPVSVRLALLDIKGHWAESYIQKLFDRGVVNGVGDNLYKPDSGISRADFVVMLWRAMESPAVAEPSTFSDVPRGTYYSDAVAWAQDIGLSNGVGDGYEFDPTGPLTREQAFTLVYRLLGLLRAELPEPRPETLDAFTDGASVSGFARDAVACLIQRGLVSGSDGQLRPGNQMTRAEMAKVLDTAVYS